MRSSAKWWGGCQRTGGTSDPCRRDACVADIRIVHVDFVLDFRILGRQRVVHSIVTAADLFILFDDVAL